MSSTPRLNDWLTTRQPLVLGLFRIVLGLLFASEGAATVFGILDRKASPVGDWPFWYAGVIELTCGVLILLGLATRGAAFLSSGVMAFAYFTEHQKDGLFPLQNGGLAPVLFCWGFLLLVFTGPGALSLTGLTGRETDTRPGSHRVTEPSP
ncbi:DoxX family protein [Streptomyces europaeiscabiei]|uniref:DoxX family protein n=1 Tax=Streptomyces europaeiscabiei TaxID=146819 RepID=UPI0029BF9BC3|nr:DoxX family protein [Streptomyces europaeiscabiei]MDX2765992.1 DoxX family protein [Streptomyces europaeiscabiei]